MSWKINLKDLREKKYSLKKIANSKQRKHGKLTARERINLLLDKGSFHELDLFVRPRYEEEGLICDGVITGFGLIDGRKVYVYSQDFTQKGGTVGEMHAKKIQKVINLAIKTGHPIIGIEDSGGARIEEGIHSLEGYANIFYGNAKASGIVPQISVVLGPCAGGAVYSPALTDFVFMVKGISKMFITGPKVVKSVLGEKVSLENLGGAQIHAELSGIAHFEDSSETASLMRVRKLLSYLPSNNMSDPPLLKRFDKGFGSSRKLSSIVPSDPKKSYSMLKIIEQVFDKNSFMEVHSRFAKNIITGFARLNNSVVGVVANQPENLAGCIDIDASAKASRFVRFCDSFNIPIVNLVDTPGYLPGKDQEHRGIIKHGADLLFAYAEASVPKVSIVLRKAFGGAYIVLASKGLRYDAVLSWPIARIAVMGSQQAADILFKDHEDIKTMIDEYEKEFLNPYAAAEAGFVDKIIEPSETRKELINILDLLKTKRVKRPARKHGNIPL